MASATSTQSTSSNSNYQQKPGARDALSFDVVGLMAKAARDPWLQRAAIALIVIWALLSLICSVVLGLLVLACFVIGATVAIGLLLHRNEVEAYCAERWSLEALMNGWMGAELAASSDAEESDSAPQFGAEVLAKEPWKAVRIDGDLDRAVDSFFSRILATFIVAWYSHITASPHFTAAIRSHLREALARLIVRIRDHTNWPHLITGRLLPICIAHYELVHTLHSASAPTTQLADAAHQLPYAFSATWQHSVHPACRTRDGERRYLRRLATFLVPRLCPNAGRQQALDSRVFGSLLRELFAQWALLPLMDVLADPNLINQLVLIATNRSAKPAPAPSLEGRVEFLQRFVARRPAAKGAHRPDRARRREAAGSDSGSLADGGAAAATTTATAPAADLLTDQTQLYSFMQYLKREGAVDVLRFYLDVDALNADLLDPRVTTDPVKLSALQQQSERLLSTYRELQTEQGVAEEWRVRTLAEAHELVRAELLGSWQVGFRGTAEYYRVVYGERECREAAEEAGNGAGVDGAAGGGFRWKLKGALRGPVDGAPLDGGMEPGGGGGSWDSYGDESPTNSGHQPQHHHQHQPPHPSGLPGPNSSSHANNHPNNHNIYSSVTQKLRKERGQRLDHFIGNFMHSIEHVPDLGVDATAAAKPAATAGLRKRTTAPGRNPTFGDLFGLVDDGEGGGGERVVVNSTVWQDARNAGASGCLIFILVRLLNVPVLAMRFVVAICAIAGGTVDWAVCHLLRRLLRAAVYEPRLALLIGALEHHLFDVKHSKHSDATSSSTSSSSSGSAVGQPELSERRRQARTRLGRIHAQLPALIDALQSPAMNKQLMYTLLDVVLVELWPELDKRSTCSGTSTTAATNKKHG